MAGQEFEAHKIAERVGQREDLGGHATLGAAYGLALSPPFAPCPWQRTGKAYCAMLPHIVLT
jgi:hypothetical protein